MRSSSGVVRLACTLILSSLGLAAAFRAEQQDRPRQRRRGRRGAAAMVRDRAIQRFAVARPDLDVAGQEADEEASADDFGLAFESCNTRMQDSEVTLDDFKLNRSVLLSLFKPLDVVCQKNWWQDDDHGCDQEWARKISVEHFLRAALVGKGEEGVPTLYTPAAQEAAVRTMWELLPMLRDMPAPPKPTRPFMEALFRGIDVADSGSWGAAIGNLVASVVNRGFGDTLYRSKAVTTHPYSGVNEDEVRQYNTMTYEDEYGSQILALDIQHIPFSEKKSFVYNYPPGPGHIVAELERILQEFKLHESVVENFATAETWLRKLVILHPFTDSNGRAARVALNLVLLANGLPPAIMRKQDEDLTESPGALRNKICEGTVYGAAMFRQLPDLHQDLLQKVRSDLTCCTARDQASGRLFQRTLCLSVPRSIGCSRYSDLTFSQRYLDWTEDDRCGGHVFNEPESCWRSMLRW